MTEGIVRYFDVSITVCETDSQGNLIEDGSDLIEEDANVTIATADPSPVNEILNAITDGLRDKVVDIYT